MALTIPKTVRKIYIEWNGLKNVIFPSILLLPLLGSLDAGVPLLLHIDPVDWKPPMPLMGVERKGRNYPQNPESNSGHLKSLRSHKNSQTDHFEFSDHVLKMFGFCNPMR